jgi:peptide/nickel transport system permease protein
VLFRHVLRNALIPILTGVVVVLPLLFIGSLLTESFFGIPGWAATRSMRSIGRTSRSSGDGLSRCRAVHHRAVADRYLVHHRRSAGPVELMSVQPVVLWTDALIYLLLVLVMLSVWYTRRHEHLLKPWRQVARRRTAQVAMVVLGFYIAVGLLDTLHFNPQTGTNDDGAPIYSTEVLSLFDHLVGPLRTQQEKTYSAPFAIRLFSKESIDLPDGTQLRDFPRLVYGGAHLPDDGSGKGRDIAARAALGAAKGMALWLLAMWALSGFRLHRLLRLLRGDMAQPWHVGAYTALLLGALLAAALELSGYYHVLGTDKVGESVFYQALKSIRTGLVIGTLTTLVMLPLAILLGSWRATSAAGSMTSSSIFTRP